MELLNDLVSNEWQYYLRVEPSRNLNDTHEKIKKNKFLYSNFTGSSVGVKVESFFNEINDYESKIKKDFNNRRARYGMEITMLLPKKEWENSELIKLGVSFMKMVIQKENRIKYVISKYSKGDGLYLFIYVYDREYGKIIKKYKRDFIVNKNTRKACSASDPDAIILHKAGEVIKDKDGNDVKEIFKSTKTRIFCYKSSEYNYWLNMIREYYVQALLKMKAKIKKGFILRRKNLNKAFNRFCKRIIVANNKMIQYIQNEVNYWYHQSLNYSDGYDIYKNGADRSDTDETNLSREINKLLGRYREIFSLETFNNDDKTYQLNGFRCDLVEENLQILKKLFDSELKYILIENKVII